MPQEVLRQTSFNGGELDPRIDGRRDVKSYFSMVALAENVATTPAGPLTRRPGTWFVDYARHQLQTLAFTAENVVTYNGGTPADLLTEGAFFVTEQDLTDADHWLLTIDFGAPIEIAAVDVVDYCVKPEAAAEPEPPPFVYPYPPPVFDGPIDVGPIFEGGDLP